MVWNRNRLTLANREVAVLSVSRVPCAVCRVLGTVGRPQIIALYYRRKDVSSWLCALFFIYFFPLYLQRLGSDAQIQSFPSCKVRGAVRKRSTLITHGLGLYSRRSAAHFSPAFTLRNTLIGVFLRVKRETRPSWWFFPRFQTVAIRPLSLPLESPAF